MISCNNENKTDENLLTLDKKELNESLDSYKITLYKFVKIAIRGSAEKDSTTENYKLYNSDFQKVYTSVFKYDSEQTEELTLLDYLSIYRDYLKMKSFVNKTDEDIFPTLLEGFQHFDSNYNSINTELLKGEKKELAQNIEHAVLSALVLASQDLGREIALYECYKTNPDKLPDSEIKSLLQFYRGYLFFTKGLYYLSEEEITQNIEWLDNNKDIEFKYSKVIFPWGNFSNKDTYTGVHGINHLFRGMDRLMMKREIDEKRALADFEVFLQDFSEIGVDNEITWSVETYLYLKNEESEKAIKSLKKLKTSRLLSSKEKKQIDESIDYLEKRESDKLLNGIYDKYFLSKIATKYMISVLAEIDWEKELKKNDVPYTDEMFQSMDNFNKLIINLQELSSKEKIKETGEDIKKKGKSLFNKAKELVN